VLAQLTDTITGQTGSAEKNVRVEPLAGDPFPDMWRDLPTVEFWPGDDGFEHWFAPSLKERLHLTLDTQQPVKIDLLVNTTPSEITLRRRDATLHGDQNMSVVIPAMKTIFQTEVRNGSLGVTLLDISRQRVIFSQDNRREMDWPRLKQSVEGGDPNKIDVHSLANRETEGDFFVATVGAFLERALAAGEPKHVVIVLSGVMGFREGVPLHPIESKGNANCMVFYIRYSSHGPFVTNGFEARSPVSPRRATSPPAPRTGWMDFDQLAGTLKPLNPRLYDISSPMEFRKALASIFAEIAR
jgi:hypothetical protein